jgi:Zn-dependent protease with chaperone function
MGHIKNRDVLKAYTTEVPLKLTLSLLWFDISAWDISLLDVSWKLLSKETEAKADDYWLEILEKYKINPLCAKVFFERDHNFWDSVMELMSDHPLNLTRIKKMERLAQKMWFTDSSNCKKLLK